MEQTQINCQNMWDDKYSHADYMSTIIKQLTLNAKCVNHWHEISASHDYLLIQITLKTKINIE